MTERGKKRLLEQGYLIIEGLMPPPMLAELREAVDRLFDLEGDNAGAEFKLEPQTRRLANLVDKGEIFRRMIAEPRVLEGIEAILGPRFKLSSLNGRSANPHSDWVQPLHADAGAIADERGYWVANSVWLLDDFTPENGATRMITGSHRWGKLPQEVMADPAGPHPHEELVLAKAGDVVLMNAHMWHGGTANRTGEHRRALHGFYTRFDQPQQQYQKKMLRAETIARLSDQERRILAIDDPLNDELSSVGSGKSGFLK